VTTHLGNGVPVHGYQQNAAAHIGCGRRCFATGVAGAYYYYIVFFKHFLVLERKDNYSAY
jgi:hypothetical protein